MVCTFTREDGKELIKNTPSGNIIIPEGVTEIREGAFYDCDSLKSIVIPEGVTEIRNSTFARCRSLRTVTIPESVVKINDCAFYDCDSLKYINIPEGVTSIGNYVFKGCKSLKYIVLPGGDESNYGYGSYKGIQHIGSSIFDRCRNLESVTIHCGSGCWLTPDMFGRNGSNLRSVRITHYSFKDAYTLENKENEYVISIPKSELVDGSDSPNASGVCNLFTDMCINLGTYMNKREK